MIEARPLKKTDCDITNAHWMRTSAVLGLVEWLKGELCLSWMDNKTCEKQRLFEKGLKHKCLICSKLDEGVKQIK